MKREESGYNIELEQAANGITRKETKQTECAHQRKKKGLTIQSDKSKKTVREMNQGNSLASSKKLKKQNTRLPNMCKDENNIVITQINQILKRWKDYFCTVLNLDIDDSFSNNRIQPTTSGHQTDVEISPPSYNEVCSIINKLKSNKTGGTDNIIPELIKQGGRTLKQRIYKLILMIWDKDQLPNQWKEGRKEGRNNLPVV